VYLSGLILNRLLKNGIISSREKIIMQQNINLCPSRIFQNSSINFYRSVYERKGVYAYSSIRLISFVLIVHQRQALASADIFY